MKAISMQELLDKGNQALAEMMRFTRLYEEAIRAGNDVLADVYAKVVIAHTDELKRCALAVLELKSAMIEAEEAKAAGMVN